MQNLMRRKQRRISTVKCTSVSNEKTVCNSSVFPSAHATHLKDRIVERRTKK